MDVLWSGEKPGKGQYRCRYCSYIVVLVSAEEALPVCPLCGAREWYDLEVRSWKLEVGS